MVARAEVIGVMWAMGVMWVPPVIPSVVPSPVVRTIPGVVIPRIVIPWAIEAEIEARPVAIEIESGVRIESPVP